MRIARQAIVITSANALPHQDHGASRSSAGLLGTQVPSPASVSGREWHIGRVGQERGVALPIARKLQLEVTSKEPLISYPLVSAPPFPRRRGSRICGERAARTIGDELQDLSHVCGTTVDDVVHAVRVLEEQGVKDRTACILPMDPVRVARFGGHSERTASNSLDERGATRAVNASEPECDAHVRRRGECFFSPEQSVRGGGLARRSACLRPPIRLGVADRCRCWS